jgi:hypothetical protein
VGLCPLQAVSLQILEAWHRGVFSRSVAEALNPPSLDTGIGYVRNSDLEIVLRYCFIDGKVHGLTS